MEWKYEVLKQKINKETKREKLAFPVRGLGHIFSHSRTMQDKNSTISLTL